MAWFRAVCLSVVMAACGAAQGQADAPPAHQPEPYQRVVEEDGGNIVRLEMAVREFAPDDPAKPRVYFAGAVHIAEGSFYKALQDFLDAQDVVLFEGVKPPGAGAPEHDLEAEDPAAKKATSRRRVRFLAMAVERYRARNDALPKSLEELARGSEGRVAQLLDAEPKDAWGNPIVYSLVAAPEDGSPPSRAARRGYDLISYGADGVPGGEGDAADLKYSDQKAVSREEKGDRSEGLQTQLANALGVVFQLDAMDHDKPHWRNSDLSVDQVQARLERVGVDADGLFGTLDGSSFMSRLTGAFLGLLGATPDSRAMLKTMMIEVIGRADLATMQMPESMRAMMDVLLEDRNAVVIDDLKRLIDTEPNIRTVGIIYGAGHLPSLEKRLVQEMGYRPVGDVWHAALSVDAEAAGVAPAQLRQMRRMVERMMDRQMNRPARKKTGS